ncbi:RPA-related protein RADX isoform X2 [Melanotaenia boesemani]|uniref:RPA-related protein RADX isoform X2 n=1 Tax=Melanotaenia boesemani TaxID=1250792 RepID=UPI001C057483|nr:RPA-related protein RADX isoform X2 [Melanotaenia boesemani]
MAADGCVFSRTLTRSRSVPNKPSSSWSSSRSSSSPVGCRELLFVVDVQRYSRDQGSTVYFPQAVLSGDDLYDIILTDGHCRLQVTLDPGLNRLVERNILRPGAVLSNAAFCPALSAQLPERPVASGDRDSYRLVSVEVRDEAAGDEEDVRRTDWDSLPWFGSSGQTGETSAGETSAGPAVPLRANRTVFLPLWNNVDHSGETWRSAPPTDEDEEDEEAEEEEGRRPTVTVSELRDAFLSSRRGVAKGAVHHQLIVRIINKSHLMYYGRSDRSCECPYKAVLQVCDQTGSVCVVLWNSVCVSWYNCLKLGDIISLRRYRVKQQYQAHNDDIEISVNSRNPAAQISLLPESSVSPECLPPAPTHSFYSSAALLDCPDGALCDVIGLLMFAGRSERIRSKDGRGVELLEYRWLRLEDGSSDKPIMVKLFSTSQPETHLKLHPLSVLVCTRLKLIRSADGTSGCFYLTNTTYTQVYCTGQGHHSQMSYRKLHQVRHFLRWLRSQDDGQVLSRALIGGFFTYPPPPISLETYMKERRGELGFLRGAELQRELERLSYRERRTFCIQATVTMVTYSRLGEEDHCLFWVNRSSSLSPSSSSSSSPRPSTSTPCSSLSSPHSFRPPLSPPSFSPTSPSSAASQTLSADLSSRKRRKLLLAETPKKRLPRVMLQPEQNNKTDDTQLYISSISPLHPLLSGHPPQFTVLFPQPVSLPWGAELSVAPRLWKSLPSELQNIDSFPSFTSELKTQQFKPASTWRPHPSFCLSAVILFQASMEFLENTPEDDDEDDDASSFTTAPLPPAFPPVAMETLPMPYDHIRREEQAVALAMGGRLTCGKFDFIYRDYYTLRLRALSDRVLLDTVFLPHASSSSTDSHSNTWTSILSHGAFSSHTPPPAPADLIAMSAQLTNQRLVCVLEACHLGGARTELVLTRAFQLTD